MDSLITKVFDLIKDYRSDERDPSVMVTEGNIKRWVNQFDEHDRTFLLDELTHIFSKRYISKDRAKSFLRKLIIKLSSDGSYNTIQDFLSHTIFLDLQPKGKSQKVLLKILKEIIEQEYSFDFTLCGSKSKTNNVYIDDILATGNTLFQDIKKWVGQEFSTGLTNLEALQRNNTKLFFSFIFIHEKNLKNKGKEFGIKIEKDFDTRYTTIYGCMIDNKMDSESKYEFVIPVESGQPDFVLEYNKEIEQNVDKYTENYQNKPQSSFYRNEITPKIETLFSSSENRIRFENLMLSSGIQILKGSNNIKKNIRALGYSLPSHKDFGFGTLCFTWRNVPNNTPLTFWYSDNNYPLFTAKKGNTLTLPEILSEYGL
ncbi:MAG: hypothetical protein HYZ54_03760 [Ignavibacteriae bacterium]|nr:hypothetical protein [Ignavibacteriota bacterium]